MKKVMAATVGILIALAPAGPAFAGDGPNGTAWGNCKTSAAGGRAGATPAPGGVPNGRGFGGHAKVPCPPDAPVGETPPTQPPAQPPVDEVLEKPLPGPGAGDPDDLR